METLAQRIVKEGLSVRATEEAVALGVKASKPRRAAVASGRERRGLRRDRGAPWATGSTRGSRIAGGRAKGTIVIEFGSSRTSTGLSRSSTPADPGVAARRAEAD